MNDAMSAGNVYSTYNIIDNKESKNDPQKRVHYSIILKKK